VFTLSLFREIKEFLSDAVYRKIAFSQTLTANSQQALAHIIDRIRQDVAEASKKAAQERFEKAAMFLRGKNLNHYTGLTRAVDLLEKLLGGGP